MKRPQLDAARAAIRARMEAGEEMEWKAVWRSHPDASRSWAHDTLKNWHAVGLVHVVRWEVGDTGPAKPVFVWGPGKDAKRPKPQSNATRCRRWRRENPEAYERAMRKDVFKRRKSPIMDPIVAALLGYRRRGSGWSKRDPVVTASSGDDCTHPLPEG